MRPGQLAELGVVVVNFGSHALMTRNLGDLPAGVRVVVVDNFSTVSERSAITALGHERGWEVVALDDNRGFGAAANVGVARAAQLGCRSFVFLNPDAIVPAPVLTALRGQLSREPWTLVAPRIADPAGRVVFQGVELQLDDGNMRRAGVTYRGRAATRPVQLWLTGACLGVHAEVLSAVGGFDEQYFLYWEDVELSVRAARAGANLLVRDDLLVVHDEGGTQARAGEAKSELYYYYNCRNRLLFAAQHADRRQLVRWLLTSVSAGWAIVARGGRRQLLYSRRPLWSAARGTGAGLAPALRALVRGPIATAPGVIDGI